MRLNISHPFAAFLGVWSLSFFLFSLQLTGNIVDINFHVVILISSSVVIALLLSALIIKKKRKPFHLSNIELKRLYKFQKILFLSWALGSGIDIIYSGGFPLLWIFQGAAKNYTDFGIPSFHGIINAIYLFLVSSIYLSYVYMPNKKKKAVLLLMLLWPILMLGRGILLGLLIQILAIYLLTHRVSLIKALKLISLIIMTILIFGYIGDIRVADSNLNYLLVTGSTLENLPSGFLWVYIYITTGINNLSFSLSTIDPLGYPYYSIINLLPSIIRSSLENHTLNVSLIQLADDNLNTNSFYSGYVSDFGLWGGVIATSLLIGLSSKIYNSAQAGKIGSYISYSIMFQCLVFSPFYDMLLLLPTIAQIFIGKGLNIYLYKHRY